MEILVSILRDGRHVEMKIDEYLLSCMEDKFKKWEKNDKSDESGQELIELGTSMIDMLEKCKDLCSARGQRADDIFPFSKLQGAIRVYVTAVMSYFPDFNRCE